MVEVTQTLLPGVGVRHEFLTSGGVRIGVLAHHNGRREVFAYAANDPDSARRLLDLGEGDARTLTELLGASQVTAVLGAVRQQVEGLAIDWIELAASSSLGGHTIGASKLRTRTGASVVAVIRGAETTPAPGPEFVLQSGDVVVAAGTAPGLETLRGLLDP
jgi:TrkA domain protein